MTENKQRRCTDCAEHSGVVARLKAGGDFMSRLEKSIDELRTDFTNHVNSSARSTNVILIGIIMCFLTGVVSIYVSNTNSKNEISSQAEVQMIVKETIKNIKK